MKTAALRIGHVTAGILLLLAPVAAAGASPVPVSPGGPAGGLAKDTCPAFSWSQGDGGGPYELVVYPVTAEGELGAEPALAARLPAGAQSWTPSADRCLQAGSRYAWTLREIGDVDWSGPALFEVALPSRAEVAGALETLRRYLDGGGEVEEVTGTRDSSEDRLGRGQLQETERRPTAPQASESLQSRERHSAIVPLVPSFGIEDGGLTAGVEPSHSTGTAAIHAVESSTSAESYGVWARSDSSQGAGVLGMSGASIGGAGVTGRSTSPQGHGVIGVAWSTTGQTYGVTGGSMSSQGTGVRGSASATSGFTRGVEGRSDSTQGAGVYGLAFATGGATVGVYGRSNSTAGVGVFGLTNASTGDVSGVHGVTASTIGQGVFGEATATSGSAYGVYGVTSSNQGWGLHGEATTTNGFTHGVHGVSRSTQGRGVVGVASASSGGTIGVFGHSSSPDGWAGYFTGKVEVTGNLVKGGGSFKIDHPLDPADRFLSHSFVESPDMMNVYNGNVVLDEEGAAWVDLPKYFDALNRDFRYQLTALRRAAPRLHIAQTIADNRFRIAGGEAGMEVSWLVTGIRQDAYAERHPIVVEEDKGELRGRYLHPEAHDQPAELAIGYVQPTEMEVAEVPSAPSRAGKQEELANESRGTHGIEASGAKATLSRSSLDTDPTEGDRR